jgi:hypothetical protein
MHEQQRRSLTAHYHEAKSERKCLTSSFKVKTTTGNHNEGETARPKPALITLILPEKPTSGEAALAKPSVAKEYYATRRSFTASRAASGKEDNAKMKHQLSQEPLPAKSKIANEESARSKATAAKSKPFFTNERKDNGQEKSKPPGSAKSNIAHEELKKSKAATAKSKPSLANERRATRQNQNARPESPPVTQLIKYQQFHPVINESTRPQHTATSGYELLGISRLDDKRHELGLADGIKLHLIESIKLCGVRKGECYSPLLVIACDSLRTDTQTLLCEY